MHCANPNRVFSDINEAMAIQIRSGVAVIHDATPDHVDATITIDAAKVRELSADIAAVDDVIAGAASVSDEAVAREFFGYFDPLPAQPPKIVLR